jgi:hypothetical protein
VVEGASKNLEDDRERLGMAGAPQSPTPSSPTRCWGSIGVVR